MARADYAGMLDRHAGEAETLAGELAIPVIDGTEHTGEHATGAGERITRGHAIIDSAAMHRNRWPALFGGFLFDLAYRGCAAVASRRPLSLELHFLRAIRRPDVPETGGLRLAWRATIPETAGVADAAPVVTLTLGEDAQPIAYGTAVFDAHRAAPAAASPQVKPGTRLVLPAHDADWRPGYIGGRCLEPPGSLPAIADTLLAKAMSTVRGDDCPDDMHEHFLVRTLTYFWVEPVDDAPAELEARVVQRGKRMALAVGTFTVDGRVVGRTTGTVALQRAPRT